MPHFILLAGPSGSGKSSLRAKLVAGLVDAVVLSSDDFLETWARDDGLSYQESFARHRDAAMAAVAADQSDAFARGAHVIRDQTHLTAEVRRERLAEVPDSYTRIAIAFEAPLDTLYARLSRRAAETGKHIPETVLHEQVACYTRPHFDEGWDKVLLKTPDMPDLQILS